MIYQASWTDELKSEWIIGYFSTVQKAHNACQEWHDLIWQNARRLLWIGKDETFAALSEDTRFEVNPIELDVAAKPFPVIENDNEISHE